MAENKDLFSLGIERFQEVWDPPNFINLQHEFKIRNIPLSQSLLTWTDEVVEVLADFENTKTYETKRLDATIETQTVPVWERASKEEQLVASRNTERILSHLRIVQGTNLGHIDLLRRLNLAEINSERLRRSDLSPAGFGFEFLHQDLLIVHAMFRDILTSSRESLLNLSRGQLIAVNQNLQTFYDHIRQIEDFEISGENPREAHARLLQQISRSCDSTKQILGDIVALLSSRKADQLGAQVNTTVGEAVERLDAETSKAAQSNEELKKQKTQTQQEFEELKLELQNQLAEKPISQYKAIFSEQAQEHKKNSRFWLGMTGVATGAFALAFFLLSMFLKFEGAGLTATLQNLFTKGFLLSPIYVWLNRSIKNHTAQKHLEVINTHRQNALETFDTFVAAAEGNRETRDAVLLAATEAIFDANQTGYLSTKGSGPDSRNPILHIIRESLTQKSSSKQG